MSDLPSGSWHVAEEMVDKRTSRVWSRPYRRDRRQMVGLLRFPDHVIVGLFVSRRRNADPVDELLRNDAFQRACVGLAREAGEWSAVVSATTASRSSVQIADRPRAHVAAGSCRLGEKATALARNRFGLDLHVGVSTLSLPLPTQFQAALAAAESALSKGLRVVPAEVVTTAANPLRQLRRDLAKVAEVTPSALPARFDRYVAAVAAHVGYQLDPCRAHLDAALERTTEVLASSGALDDKSIEAIEEAVQRTVAASNTIDELFAAYRRAIADIASAIVRSRPPAHRDRSLRRAVEFLRQHYAERSDPEASGARRRVRAQLFLAALSPDPAHDVFQPPRAAPSSARAWSSSPERRSASIAWPSFRAWCADNT